MKRFVPLALLLLAASLHLGRVRYIRAFFRPGPATPATAVQPAADGSPPVATGPVRVLLVDGLSAWLADQLPAHRRLCAEGLTLEVEVGFPSVSLPVQHVLWTGAWQARSGIAFTVARLPRPVFLSIPELASRRPGGSVAVADAHREVVASFPFSRIVAPAEGASPFTPAVFQRHALVEAASPAALVLVHSLSVDEAGHRAGAISARYREAALRSDQLLTALLPLRRPDWTLLALSDHGHLPRGGHGDREPEVRTTRACLAGPGIPAGRRLRVGMTDLTAILAERLELPAPPACSGRGLSALLLGAPASTPEATGPGGRGSLLALAALSLFPAALLALRQQLRRRRQLLPLLPWAPALAALLLLALGPPSLSRGFIYPSLSPLLLAVGLAAGLLLILQLWTALRTGLELTPALLLLGASCLAPTLAVLAAGGWPWRQPPLVPGWTGWASSLLEVTAVGLGCLGLAALLLGRLSGGASTDRR